jgi:hypothetical protein
MTIIKNAAKFSYSEVYNALIFDNENDFCFLPVEEKQEIKVFFNDFVPTPQLQAITKENEDITTIKVDEENIAISLGKPFSSIEGMSNSFFSDMETILANYLIVAINNYNNNNTSEKIKSKVAH